MLGVVVKLINEFNKAVKGKVNAENKTFICMLAMII